MSCCRWKPRSWTRRSTTAQRSEAVRTGTQASGRQLGNARKTTPLDLAANERAEKINTEDRKYYFDVQRPFNLKMADFNLKRARNSLEYTEEELRQLEKMYAADNVTEETEAIVLKRARDQLESAKVMVESSQISRDHELNFDIPRSDDRTRESSQHRELEIAERRSCYRKCSDASRSRSKSSASCTPGRPTG